MFTVNMNKMNVSINTSLKELEEERADTIKKNREQFKNVKEVCSTYFDQYSKDLEYIKYVTKEMQDKYDNWSKILIAP